MRRENNAQMRFLEKKSITADMCINMWDGCLGDLDREIGKARTELARREKEYKERRAKVEELKDVAIAAHDLINDMIAGKEQYDHDKVMALMEKTDVVLVN